MHMPGGILMGNDASGGEVGKRWAEQEQRTTPHLTFRCPWLVCGEKEAT